MAPTPTQITTWQLDCNNLNRANEAWRTAQKEITDLNTMLVRNHLQELKPVNTYMTDESCNVKIGTN